ncbi:MAG: tRNA pseudouridine(55) synthase TruB [Robiginitomaculum sp.]
MARKKRGNPIHGWVNFDKPLGMTSTQAVGKVRWLFEAQKAGHAGTLDPLASGILPIALGDATKTVPFLVEAKKEYIATIKWGERTNTLDAEGDIVASSDVRPSSVAIKTYFPAFLGEISQTPPQFSAIKINGKRAYDLVRAGGDPKMKARTVTIHELELLENNNTHAKVRVLCGKGTYIRSFARDLARSLGTEGSLSDLRRTSVGQFTQNTTFTLDMLEELRHKRHVLEGLLSVSTALDDIPALAVTENEKDDLKLGRAITVLPNVFKNLTHAFKPRQIGDLDASRYVLATYKDKEIALCEARARRISPKRVFNIDV